MVILYQVVIPKNKHIKSNAEQNQQVAIIYVFIRAVIYEFERELGDYGEWMEGCFI